MINKHSILHLLLQSFDVAGEDSVSFFFFYLKKPATSTKYFYSDSPNSSINFKILLTALILTMNQSAKFTYGTVVSFY